MKIIKPQTLGLLTRPVEFRRQFWLGVATIAFIPIGDAPTLLPETAMWPFLAEEMPPDLPLDSAIPKTTCEVVAIAHAHAPGGAPARQVGVGIQIGPLIKTLDVFGDRHIVEQRVTDATPFTTMPIDWAHAYGGAAIKDNPSGLGAADAETPAGSTRPLPNVLDLKLDTAALTRPAGFAPVDQTWPARARLAGTYDDSWLKQDFPGFPRDIDWRFFNVAPPDQWFSTPLIGDETCAFKNLHPTQPLLRGRLPSLAPRLFLVRKGQEESGFEEVKLTLTTVWCFPHRERLVLVHHGRARLTEEDGADIARVVIGADRLGALRPAEEFRAVMLKRLARPDGALHALRDADLVPAECLSPDAAVPPPDTSVLDEVLARGRRRAERDYEAKRAEAIARGVSAASIPPLPPRAPRQPAPTPDEVRELIAKARSEAEAQKQEIEARAAAKKTEMAARLAADGLPEAEIQARLNTKQKDPPVFSAAAVLAELGQRADAMRAQGRPVPEWQAQMASPAFVTQLERAEAAARDAHRLSAHHQASADRLPAERSAEIRRIVANDTADARALYDLRGADLSGLDLSGVDLSGVCLAGADLRGSSFAGANLSKVVLAHARMENCVLDQADLTEASLGKAHLAGASLRSAILRKAVLAGADLTGASLAGADLEGADMTDAITAGADFSAVRAAKMLVMKLKLRDLHAPGIVLARAKFVECDLRGADLTEADLERAAFIDTKLDGARLCGARMRKAVFVSKSSLDGADLSDADLTEANLRQTSLAGARLAGANLQKADLSAANLTDAVLMRVRGGGAQFVAADLRRANLHGAALANADLSRADLRGTDLTAVSVYEANLARARLDTDTRRTGMQRTRMRYLPTAEARTEEPGGAAL